MIKTKDLVVLDCEVYKNYFLVAFKRLGTGDKVTIECKGADNKLGRSDVKRLDNVMTRRLTFGFNSRNYDIPIILAARKEYTCEELWELSNEIISNNQYGWQTMQKHNLVKPNSFEHFDIQEPAPGVKVSLKLYGGRMHSKRLQDLPYDPQLELTEKQMCETKKYCVNDLNTTIDLFHEIEDRIDLRDSMIERYGDAVLSKSDAQIAEVVIKHDLQEMLQRKLKAPSINKEKVYKYKTPNFIQFKTKKLQNALKVIQDSDFTLDAKGSIQLPTAVRNLKLDIGYSTYQLGIGGIHSNEKSQAISVDRKDMLLVDRDVASYYPNIILNLGLYPEHLGPKFLHVYRKIVEDRLKAKKEGNKVVNESLKIVINGSFGKLGNKWSALYSPDLMMQVTITGQLALLMLIERAELAGYHVVSANTDGFVTLMPRAEHNNFDFICFGWEMDTGFELEETQYRALYSRDVNNYLAITKDGKTKGKGIFTVDDLQKNPQANICVKAVEKYLVDDVPLEKTIYDCEDIRQFLTVRTVAGGATWNDDYLGRVVRWIYSKEGQPIFYKKENKHGNHNKVAKSDGARPIMQLPDELPKDIDYDRYITEAQSILDDIGLNNLSQGDYYGL